jgi:hypothetical protein
MQAPDPRAAMAARVDSLNEAFFAAASAYVALARRDGEPDVAAKLEELYHMAARLCSHSPSLHGTCAELARATLR